MIYDKTPRALELAKELNLQQGEWFIYCRECDFHGGKNEIIKHICPNCHTLLYHVKEI